MDEIQPPHFDIALAIPPSLSLDIQAFDTAYTNHRFLPVHGFDQDTK